MKTRYLLLTAFIFLFLINSISAVELNNSLIQTSSGNINISIGACSIFFDNLIIGSNYVYFVNLRTSNLSTDVLTFNMTTTQNIVDGCSWFSNLFIPIIINSPTDSAIYNVFNSVGSGLAIFLQFMILVLPALLIGIAVAIAIILIFRAIAKSINYKSYKK